VGRRYIKLGPHNGDFFRAARTEAIVNSIRNYDDSRLIDMCGIDEAPFGKFRNDHYVRRTMHETWSHPSIPTGKSRIVPFGMVEHRDIVDGYDLARHYNRTAVCRTPKQTPAD
jgi:hypothetical protein